jgi:hypothetical protein
MKEFGAKTVESFDVSNYEGATFIFDFNEPINHDKQYDTILDLGSSEHVFNVAQCLKNLAALCAVGGQIIHSLPADNMNGHGFWQFSAEVFFSLYSKANGFAETEVILAEVRNHSTWYRVREAPADGKRLQIGSHSPISALVRTKKIADVITPSSPLRVQQSDYVHTWSKERIVGAPALPGVVARRPGRHSIQPLMKRALAVSPALFRWARRTHSVLNDIRYQLRTARYPATRPDLFEELQIEEVIR